MANDEIVVNGIFEESGRTCFRDLTAQDVADDVRRTWEENRADPKYQVPKPPVIPWRDSRSLLLRRDRSDVAKAGWGVILSSREPPESKILEALEPLIDFRRGQCGRRCHVFSGREGVNPGEDLRAFLNRHSGNLAGQIKPEEFPLYLLIVGSPEDIPFDIQYGLDLRHNVGRLHLDGPEQYHNYATTVRNHEERIRAEGDKNREPCRIRLFHPRHKNLARDRATKLAEEELIGPLLRNLASGDRSGLSEEQIDLQPISGASATKKALQHLIGGGGTPDILLSASHGLFRGYGDKDQLARQGALVCSDWESPDEKATPSTQTFAASDLTPGADLSGLIALLFACYSAGTPLRNRYHPRKYGKPKLPLAKQPFIGSLPKTMLGAPKGALAVIGHVERVWSSSFYSVEYGPRTQAFQALIEELIHGTPVGEAFQPFNDTFAVRSYELDLYEKAWRDQRDTFEDGGPKGERIFIPATDRGLAHMQLERNDAQDWILLGDPGVRLRAG